MRAYYPSQFRAEQLFKKPLCYGPKEHEKSKNSASTFFRVTLSRPRSDEYIDRDKLRYGIISIRPLKTNDYFIELDNHRDTEPHLHFWRSRGYYRVPDTRSVGIALSSSVKEGLKFSRSERNREPKPNDIQRVQILQFVEENRYLLYLMIMAFKGGKVKDFEGMDAEYVKSLFSPQELDRLNTAFMSKYVIDPSQLGD